MDLVKICKISIFRAQGFHSSMLKKKYTYTVKKYRWPEYSVIHGNIHGKLLRPCVKFFYKCMKIVTWISIINANGFVFFQIRFKGKDFVTLKILIKLEKKLKSNLKYNKIFRVSYCHFPVCLKLLYLSHQSQVTTHLPPAAFTNKQAIARTYFQFNKMYSHSFIKKNYSRHSYTQDQNRIVTTMEFILSKIHLKTNDNNIKQNKVKCICTVDLTKYT